MANTLTHTNPPFARITEGRRTNSWAAALPAAVFAIALVVLMAYFASRASSYSQQLAGAQREAQTQQKAAEDAQKHAATLQSDLNVLKGAGRTTVILQSAQPAAKTHGKDAPAAASAWGAATWGEMDSGKSWMHVAAYGLAGAGEGKSYIAWLEPLQGEPVSLGKLEADGEGSGALLAKDLPGVDQAKRVFVALGDEASKTPGVALFEAQLPKLKPLQAAPKAAEPAASDAKAAPAAKAADAPAGKAAEAPAK